MKPKYTLRVYGFLFDSENRVLISREYFKGKYMFKFPGGGMEMGEGTIDALIREFQEELNVEIRVKDHIYTTDFHTLSSFDSDFQVVSIYYLVELTNASCEELVVSEEKHSETKKESFQWFKLTELNEDSFTFNTEKRAFEALQAFLRN